MKVREDLRLVLFVFFAHPIPPPRRFRFRGVTSLLQRKPEVCYKQSKGWCRKTFRGRVCMETAE